MDHIYLITDDLSNKNTHLERNRKILANAKLDYDVFTCKDLASLYAYQNQIKDCLIHARTNNYERIMILNGNDLLNTKFGGLLDKQIAKLGTETSLWFLGNQKETPPKDIINTRFELEDYLYLYDDISLAKLTTLDKAKNHWKAYGHREGRYAVIEVYNPP